MENVTLKDRLIELLRRAHADEQALLSSLSAEERAATGTREHWSAKDIIAHITFWEERLLQRLAARARGESFAGLDDGEVDEVNATTFEANRSRSWDQVQTEAEAVFSQMLAMVAQFGEEQLADPAPIGWYNNRSLTASIVGNSYTHPEAHLAFFQLERGNRTRAIEMQQAAAEAAINFDGSPASRGTALYNLACFYALAADSTRAIEVLRQALPLRPDLVEWSKQDTDLVSLRDLSEYRALYVP